jgi:DNA repair exonuclease SbcCD nuclease subunit
MRAVLTADIHIHPWSGFSTQVNGINSRLIDIVEVLSEIDYYADENEIKHWFILGDIFHKRNNIEIISYNILYKLLTKASKNKTIHLLVGNHDQTYVTKTYNSLTPLQRENIKVYDKPTIKEIDGVKVFFLPFDDDHDTLSGILRKNSTESDLVMGHMGIHGASVIGSDFFINEGVKIHQSLDNRNKITEIFLGHYHTPQKISSEADVFYCGSPLHHTFHDYGQQKSFINLDTDSDQRVTRIETDYPKFIKITAKSDADIVNKVTTYDYYSIEIQGFKPSDEALNHIKNITNQFYLTYKTKGITRKYQGDRQTNFISEYLKKSFDEGRVSLYKKIQQILAQN